MKDDAGPSGLGWRGVAVIDHAKLKSLEIEHLTVSRSLTLPDGR